MAYINQERKKLIHADLKKVIPSGWKWSLSIDNHSTLVLTIAAAPVDLLDCLCFKQGSPGRYSNINTYHILDVFKDNEPVIADLFVDIHKAMMKGNHDNSDIQSDYFDVGWYTKITIGKWDKPFQVLPD